MMRTVLAMLVVLWALPIAAAPDSGTCNIHNIKTQPARMRIVYGLPSSAELKEAEAARDRFPFGRDYVRGGCIVQPAKTVDGILCPDCVQARAKWLRKHGSRRPEE
jgi:hypothetical protein